jgi:hypothetical protein
LQEADEKCSRGNYPEDLETGDRLAKMAAWAAHESAVYCCVGSMSNAQFAMKEAKCRRMSGTGSVWIGGYGFSAARSHDAPLGQHGDGMIGVAIPVNQDHNVGTDALTPGSVNTGRTQLNQ